jgi:hypothetical protein
MYPRSLAMRKQDSCHVLDLLPILLNLLLGRASADVNRAALSCSRNLQSAWSAASLPDLGKGSCQFPLGAMSVIGSIVYLRPIGRRLL